MNGVPIGSTVVGPGGPGKSYQGQPWRPYQNNWRRKDESSVTTIKTRGGRLPGKKRRW